MKNNKVKIIYAILPSMMKGISGCNFQNTSYDKRLGRAVIAFKNKEELVSAVDSAIKLVFKDDSVKFDVEVKPLENVTYRWTHALKVEGEKSVKYFHSFEVYESISSCLLKFPITYGDNGSHDVYLANFLLAKELLSGK